MELDTTADGVANRTDYDLKARGTFGTVGLDTTGDGKVDLLRRKSDLEREGVTGGGRASISYDTTGDGRIDRIESLA